MSDSPEDASVVPLRETPPAPPPPPPATRPGRLHSMAMSGLVFSAIAGIGSLLVFVTVGWPGNTGRIWIAILVFSILGFLTSAAMAVLAAMRDTYPRRGSP